jgi:hypothetical protein
LSFIGAILFFVGSIFFCSCRIYTIRSLFR